MNKTAILYNGKLYKDVDSLRTYLLGIYDEVQHIPLLKEFECKCHIGFEEEPVTCSYSVLDLPNGVVHAEPVTCERCLYKQPSTGLKNLYECEIHKIYVKNSSVACDRRITEWRTSDKEMGQD